MIDTTILFFTGMVSGAAIVGIAWYFKKPEKKQDDEHITFHIHHEY